MPLLRWIKDYNAKNGNSVTCLGIDNESYSTFGRLCLYKFLECANTNGALDSLCYDVISYNKPITVNPHLAPDNLSSKEIALVQKCIDNMDEHNRSTQMLTAHRDEKMAEMMRLLYDMYVDSVSTVTFYGNFLQSSFIVEPCTPFIHNSLNMGGILKRIYGDDYSCIALSALQGDAIYLDSKHDLTCHAMQDAPYNSIERQISGTTDSEISFINTGDIPSSHIFKIRSARALYTKVEFHYTIPSICMDGMVCVNKTQHATHNDVSLKTFNKTIDAKYYDVLKSVIKKRKI